MEEGRIVSNVPPSRRANAEYDWEKFAIMARDNYPNAVKAFEQMPVTLVNSARTYDYPPFTTDSGFVQIHYRNSKVGEDGIRRGDVYISWVPGATTEQGATQ